MAKSKELVENSMLPWLNCWFTFFKSTPWPMALDAFSKGEVANMSPNSARDFLKPTVPTLETLFDVMPSWACAAFRPVSEV